MSCQTVNPVLDSLVENINEKAAPEKLAGQYLDILWYIFKNEEENYGDYPRLLDSLYQCCLKGKLSQPAIEKKIGADALFFMGSGILYEQKANSRSLLESAVRAYHDLGDSAGVSLSFLQLTIAASGMGDSLLFAGYYDQADALSSTIKSPILMALFHCNIGIGCYDFGRYVDCAAHLFKSLAIIEQYRTSELLELRGDIFHNLASVYRRLGDSDNGLLYAKKAIESAIEIGSDPSVHYTPLAWMYTEKADYKNALTAFQGTKPNKSNSDYIDYVSSIYGQATCYRNLGDVRTALPLAQKAVEMLPVSVNASFGASALMELAWCELESNMTSLALNHALLSYETFTRATNKRGSSVSAGLLSDIYKSKGNYTKALEFSELRYQFQQQIERQQSMRQLAFGEFTRDNAAQTARREAEVKAQLNRQRYIRYALFTGIGLLLILALLLYNRFRFKQKSAEQLKVKNKEVEIALKRAEASEAFKSRFLANMSHEIRTPLHGISGFTDLLQGTNMNQRQRQWLSSIAHSADRLTDVVNDILDISKLEAGGVKLRLVPFSPARIVDDVKGALTILAEKKGISLQVQVDDNVPSAVVGDPTRLYQILMNLAGNAVKFTENGSVTLSVKSKMVTTHPHPLPTSLTLLRSYVLTFSVTDTGIGIKPEKLSSIFESFQQAEDDTTAKFGGTGLGLTIARQLVRLHDSDIHVSSELGKGSTFSFQLIMQEADPSSLVVEQEIGNVFQFDQPIRILLADDNALNREIAIEAIRRHFENTVITEAVNGKEAVDFIQSNDYDIVLMDMQMPVLTGTQATHEIRRLRDTNKNVIPIIALTASATPEEIESALQSGMNGHLGKPFKPRELARTIAMNLHLESKLIETTTMPMHHAPDAINLAQDENLPDLSFLFEFTEGDRAQMIHFIQKFIDNYPKELTGMDNALKEGNLQSLYLAAHSFRPQLEFVGLKGAAALLLEMERGARDGMAISQIVLRFDEVKTILNRIPEAIEWLSADAVK